MPKRTLKAKQALVVHLKLSDNQLGRAPERSAIHALSDRLRSRLDAARAGALVGGDFGRHECALTLEGSSADVLFVTIEAELRSSELSRGGWVLKRYGDESDSSTRRVRIDL